MKSGKWNAPPENRTGPFWTKQGGAYELVQTLTVFIAVSASGRVL